MITSNSYCFQLDRICHTLCMDLQPHVPSLPEPPRIPSELWLKIFAMATSLPGALIDPAPPYRIEASPHQWPTNRVEIDENTRLKLSLVNVCRSWRQMATEFLYEIVNIEQRYDPHGSTRAKAFLWTLKTSAGVNGAKKDGNGAKRIQGGLVDKGAAGVSDHVEHGYGQWVKQLAFHTDCVSVPYVAAIVRRCPNLCTLIIDNAHVWKEAKIQSFLLPAIPESLRHIEIRHKWSGNATQKFGTILSQCSLIRAASLGCCHVVFGDDFDRLPLLQLVALTLIQPQIIHLTALKRWKLPLLTHLTLKLTVDGAELLSVVQHFGPQLLFLDVGPNFYQSDSYIQFCCCVSDYCHRLRGFVLYLEEALPQTFRSQSLTHLVIPWWKPIHTIMEKILVSELPALTCVRILARQAVPPSSSTDWVVEFRARKIRVEDGDGMDLLDQHYPIRIHYGARKHFEVDVDGFLQPGKS
jgi:hypothetical protein